MPSTRRKRTASGRDYYEIRVSQGRGKPYLTERWDVPEGWSQRAIDRELTRVAADFERRCKAGEVLTRPEKQEQERQAERERAKIKTVRQYAEQVYLPQKAVTLARRTIDSYRWTFERYIYPAFGDSPMGAVGTAQISALLLHIQSDGQKHSSVMRLYRILSAFFKSAYLDDTIPKNPMDKVVRPVPRKDELKKGEPEAYTPEELTYILECLQHEPLKWCVLVTLLIETGMRKGECCALRWSNINFETGEITVAGSLAYTKTAGVYLDTPKNGRERVVDVTTPMLAMLREWRQEQAQRAISKWVFTKDGSAEPIHPDSPTQYLSKLGKRYGIEHLHPHKLRHSFASIAITNGADVVSISEILGHSDTSITLRTYSHASAESRRRACQVFQSVISTKETQEKTEKA